MAFIALEKGYDTKSVAIDTMKRLRPTRRYGGYYGKHMMQSALWWLHGSTEDQYDAVLATGVV